MKAVVVVVSTKSQILGLLTKRGAYSIMHNWIHQLEVELVWTVALFEQLCEKMKTQSWIQTQAMSFFSPPSLSTQSNMLPQTTPVAISCCSHESTNSTAHKAMPCAEPHWKAGGEANVFLGDALFCVGRESSNIDWVQFAGNDHVSCCTLGWWSNW